MTTRRRFRAPRVSYILGDSSVFHCASLLRIIFAPSARAHERVQVLNLRDFPQAKVNSEINACFLLNEHGDLYFLLHNFGVQIILKNLRKIVREEKKI